MSALLVGRESELGQIEELLGRLPSGCGAIAVLEGPAGIGKTALVAAAAQRAGSRGFTVLRAIGGELELEYPFGVVRQLFAPVAARSWDELGNDLTALAAAPLRQPARPEPHQPLASRDEAAVLNGLYWLTADLAEQAPLLLVVDDAHWADAMSQRFVLYLARRVADLPVFLLVAARPEAGPTDGRMLARLGALAPVVWLRPSALTEPEVGQLIAGQGWRDADARFVAACHHASGGNPFLIRELIATLQAWKARGSASDAALVERVTPPHIVRWVLARLGALGEQAERLAAAFAVLGISAALADAATLAGLDPAQVAAAADALIGAHLLAAGPEYGFVHPLIRAAVAEGLGPATRATAHARAARLLAERAAPLPQVASHLLAADPGRDTWAVGVLRAAAREANLAGAPLSAAAYLERALVETPPPAVRAELLLELGEAGLQAGLAGATQRMREALELSTEPARRAGICLILGRALFTAGDWAGACEVFRRGLGELAGAGGELLLELHGWYVTLSRKGIRDAETTRLQALADDRTPPRTRAERLELAKLAYESAVAGAQPHDEVARLARRALADGVLLAETSSDPGPYAAACYALVYSGEPDEALTQLTQAVELSQRRGSPVGFGWFSLLRGYARYLRGELIEAESDFESARNTHQEEYERWLPATLGHLALCLIERADLAGSARVLVLPGGDQPWHTQPCLADYLYALGRLRAARGQAREALNTLLECGRTRQAWKITNPALDQSWRCEAALLAARLGEKDPAAELAADDLKHARTFGAPHGLGIALRTNGLIQGGDHGLGQLSEAVAVLDGSGINLELARALTEQGAALRRAGYRGDARQPLRRGLDLARRCGANALAARAREELIAAGARPRRERLTGAKALTASELRVAQLAAQGRTNRQIAQVLFVSMKTVSTHLGHIYAKLGVTDRGQLAAELAADPVPGTRPTRPRAPAKSQPGAC